MQDKQQITTELNNALDTEITRIFLSVGMPSKIKGYRFLREAVKIAYFDVSSLECMGSGIYDKIAVRFDALNGKAVERTCSYAIELASNSGKMVNLNQLVGVKLYADRNEKPSAGEFIALIADLLRVKNKFAHANFI